MIIVRPETMRQILLDLSHSTLIGRAATEDTGHIVNKLQQLIPERRPGELQAKLNRLLDGDLTRNSAIFTLLGVAAHLASNNALGWDGIDKFLGWIFADHYVDLLGKFLQLNTPTVHAFASKVLESAVRLKKIDFLAGLFSRGVNLESILSKIACMRNDAFTKTILAGVSENFFQQQEAIGLFHQLVRLESFDLAEELLNHGISVDCRVKGDTALHTAVQTNSLQGVRFLLRFNANINLDSYLDTTMGMDALAMASYGNLPSAAIVRILLDNGATVGNTLHRKGRLFRRQKEIYNLLKERQGDGIAFVKFDVMDAAVGGWECLVRYLDEHRDVITTGMLEGALTEAVYHPSKVTAVSALLQHGVDPNTPSRPKRLLARVLGPLFGDRLCLDSTEDGVDSSSEEDDYSEEDDEFNFDRYRIHICRLLIQYKVNVNIPRVLRYVADTGTTMELLQMIFDAGFCQWDQLDEGLETAVSNADLELAQLLIKRGADVNGSRLPRSPLQTAAMMGNTDVAKFLLSNGAKIDQPDPKNGRTALQIAAAHNCHELALLLFRNGADICFPPATNRGHTLLEACMGQGYPVSRIKYCLYWLDAGAQVNRPDGKPSHALSLAIGAGWDEVVTKILEPQRCALVSYMWGEQTSPPQPRTPIQLAAERGRLQYVRLLMGRGASINEEPGTRNGRTALQAAVSSAWPSMEVIQFLLDNNADINAKPALIGGLTALQGVAISGDISLAVKLIGMGADVNGAPSFEDGRYAIEGAAEHGRLDMVQLLLNAGAVGDAQWGDGFTKAIRLAERNEHFAIANILKEAEAAQKARSTA